MRFTLTSLALLTTLSSIQATLIQPRQVVNSTSTSDRNATSSSVSISAASSSSASAAQPGASNSVAKCQANTPSGQYVSFSSGYANVCCVGEPSICYYRQQNSLPSSEQCDIPSCSDLNSGNASLMKGFVDLNSGGASNNAVGNGTDGANVPGQSSAFGGTSAFPDKNELDSATGLDVALGKVLVAGAAVVYFMI